MTHNDAQDTPHEPLTTGAGSTPTELPFDYEDRSDGRHDRVVQEFRAAHAWVQQRRSRGMQPN